MKVKELIEELHNLANQDAIVKIEIEAGELQDLTGHIDEDEDVVILEIEE
jgi:hypothetical protein